MNDVYKFQVFVDESGRFGNPGSLIIDEGGKLSTDERIAITKQINHDETLFVDNIENNQVSIYHAYGEVDFAGNVLVGSAWQLMKIKDDIRMTINCSRGEIEVWREGDIVWLRANTEGDIGNWDYEQMNTPEEVDEIDVADTIGWKKMVWAWIDENQGIIRARTFASKIDIPEVQGNGSGSMNLANQLQAKIIITHGDGSIIYARPANDNCAELGGRVVAL